MPRKRAVWEGFLSLFLPPSFLNALQISHAAECPKDVSSAKTAAFSCPLGQWDAVAKRLGAQGLHLPLAFAKQLCSEPGAG
ncbi:hypothetical protein E5288_WYG019812 [Bos mutus]|uniref:Uncharacterized protein n=1 Tax=Bos mutus TaxID=72004 RepID=A0A6B0RPC7_9CETA|nr:hypothetical protein [Bos mutus]